jgi:hypothetical protein
VEEEGFLSVSLMRSYFLYDFVFFLRGHLLLVCDQLLDIWAVDFPAQKFRFLLHYKFTSFVYFVKLFLRVFLVFNFNFLMEIYSLGSGFDY